MKSNSALNKMAPQSPLNIKLREIHDIKQAANNSHLPNHVKMKIMHICDSQMNQAWRWHYDSKPGYEIIKQSPITKIKRILKSKYNLNVRFSPEYYLYATNDMINLMVVPPHEGTNHKWMLRIGPMATFDRWANSTSIERFFELPEDVAVYLEEHAGDIYKKVLESLTMDAKELKEALMEVDE